MRPMGFAVLLAGALGAAWVPATSRGDPVPGSCLEEWDLVNFQAQSATFGQPVSSASYHGRTTVVMLLASWCPYCQTQASRMEAMRQELEEGGYDVQVVAINLIAKEDTQEELVSRCSFDLLQDVETEKAWRRMGGERDDFFIYREGGALAPSGYLSADGPLSTDLSLPEGYENVYNAIVTAHDLGPGAICGAGGWQLAGDFNQDGRLDLSDAVSLLGHLFLGSPANPPCAGSLASDGNRALLDLDRDDAVNLSDAVYALNYLFRGGPPPLAGTECARIPECPNACGG